jgi:hypothetical protein
VNLALVASFLSALHDSLCGELKTLTGRDLWPGASPWRSSNVDQRSHLTTKFIRLIVMLQVCIIPDPLLYVFVFHICKLSIFTLESDILTGLTLNCKTFCGWNVTRPNLVAHVDSMTWFIFFMQSSEIYKLRILSLLNLSHS